MIFVRRGRRKGNASRSVEEKRRRKREGETAWICVGFLSCFAFVFGRRERVERENRENISGRGSNALVLWCVVFFKAAWMFS